MLFGILSALLAYRAHYQSLFDYRTNHIPLPYHATTRSFKQIPGSNEAINTPIEQAASQPRDLRPQRHLAVRWPFGIDEKRGSERGKHQRGTDQETTTGDDARGTPSRTSVASMVSPVGSEVAEMV